MARMVLAMSWWAVIIRTGASAGGFPAVFAGNARDHGQPQSAAAGALGHERDEDLLPQLGGEGAAGIGDGELPPRGQLPHADLHGPAAAVLRRRSGLAAEDLHGGADPARLGGKQSQPLR